MLASVVGATLLRFVLIYFHWPYTESDEGNMGLLAMHVAFQGDHPVWFYGAPYLGPLEGYAAAPLFRLFGISLFALRAPLVLFFAGFLVSMYYLVRLLYQSEKFALASVIVLGLGSPDVLFLQLRASGEYPEIEMFAALMCLLATWLALTSSSQGHLPGWKARWKRIALYVLLGSIVGIALWVDLLILPFVAAIIGLLVLFCRRELLRWNGLSFLFGSIVGAFPLLYYNFTAPWSQNSWYVFQRISHSAAADMTTHHLTWIDQLTGTLFVALPMATGGGLNCPLSAIPPAGVPTTGTLSCIVFQGGWSLGYLVLWGLATCLALYALSRHSLRLHAARKQKTPLSVEERQEAVRQSGRLVILASVGLTLLLYARAPASATTPVTSFRYLTCLLLALPVLLWPLWKSFENRGSSRTAPSKPALFLRIGLLLLVAATFAGGMTRAFLQIPDAQRIYQSKEALVQDMLHIGATRVYSDYWTCNILTFLSKEQIICSALNEQLNTGYDRYLPYRAIVQAESHPTYIFPSGTPQAQAMQQRVNTASTHYRRFTFEGYLVYQAM